MRINKFFSVFLSLLMVCSIFSGLSVSATTIDKTHTYTVVGDAPFLGAKWDLRLSNQVQHFDKNSQ